MRKKDYYMKNSTAYVNWLFKWRTQYDGLGNLMKASLPGDLTIDYLIDAQNRRIGKKVGAVLIQGLLCQDLLNPVTELDGSEVVTIRFICQLKSQCAARIT